jgi:DNA-binding beta-propeller fold protein YncE
MAWKVWPSFISFILFASLTCRGVYPALLEVSPGSLSGTATNAPDALLALLQTIPLPGLPPNSDFDGLAVDVPGQRLFLTDDKSSAIRVIDLHTDKLIHTISDVKEPHSVVYRADVKELYVVDGGLGEVQIYQGNSLKSIGSVKGLEGADSSAFDTSTKRMFVTNAGVDARLPYCLISVLDMTAAKKLADIKIDATDIEGMAIEKSGPRLFVNILSRHEVGVIDRETHTLIASWAIGQGAEDQMGAATAIDEAGHRLFVGSLHPPKLIVLNTDSGKVVASLPCVELSHVMAYDPRQRRIYIAGTEFVDVFQQNDADHYKLIGHIPTAFRARTALLVPEMNRYYIAVPRHGNPIAEVRVYQVLP